ncbi:helix-turn-helix domain-containing protein [Lichenibacterium dinghuense]|uniref:helix-turn-helix domain-containing protein n=1 Tax=Lichenibacterium dinghuense TaxID=2895977 RepID=UPI001F171B90|nr:helix-turn-helix transcriptional regulator [Lichenibacterium sp. 6Y81]
MSSIVPAQIRGARGMLGWSMMDLARAAGLSVSTVKRFEDAAQPRPSSKKAEAIRGAFEDHGITFEAIEGGTIGLRFDPHARPRASAFSRFM